MNRLPRVAWGLTLLIRPGAPLAAAGAPPDPHTRTAARVLGVRHLLQAAAVGPGASPRRRHAALAADLLHVATLLPLAALPRYRRAATADAAVEPLLTLLTTLTPRRPPPKITPSRPLSP